MSNIPSPVIVSKLVEIDGYAKRVKVQKGQGNTKEEIMRSSIIAGCEQRKPRKYKAIGVMPSNLVNAALEVLGARTTVGFNAPVIIAHSVLRNYTDAAAILKSIRDDFIVLAKKERAAAERRNNVELVDKIDEYLEKLDKLSPIEGGKMILADMLVNAVASRVNALKHTGLSLSSRVEYIDNEYRCENFVGKTLYDLDKLLESQKFHMGDAYYQGTIEGMAVNGAWLAFMIRRYHRRADIPNRVDSVAAAAWRVDLTVFVPVPQVRITPKGKIVTMVNIVPRPVIGGNMRCAIFGRCRGR